MSATARAELPWLRLSERTGVSEWTLGIAFALVTSAVTWLVHTFGGEIAYVRLAFEPRVPYGACNALGFMMAGFVFHMRRTRRDLGDLQPALSDADTSRLEPLVGTAPRTGLVVATLLGAAFAFTSQEVTVARWSRILGGEWNAVDLWVGPLMVSLWAVLLPTLYSIYATALVLREAGSSLEVRLFERDLGRPLTRFGLRTFLMFVVVPVLVNVALAAFQSAHVVITAFSMALSFGLGAACLLLPLGGLRARVRERKAAELARPRRGGAGRPLGPGAVAAGRPARAALAAGAARLPRARRGPPRLAPRHARARPLRPLRPPAAALLDRCRPRRARTRCILGPPGPLARRTPCSMST